MGGVAAFPARHGTRRIFAVYSRLVHAAVWRAAGNSLALTQKLPGRQPPIRSNRCSDSVWPLCRTWRWRHQAVFVIPLAFAIGRPRHRDADDGSGASVSVPWPNLVEFEHAEARMRVSTVMVPASSCGIVQVGEQCRRVCRKRRCRKIMVIVHADCVGWIWSRRGAVGSRSAYQQIGHRSGMRLPPRHSGLSNQTNRLISDASSAQQVRLPSSDLPNAGLALGQRLKRVAASE